MSALPRRLTMVWFCGIIAAALAVRVGQLSKGPYHSDCLLLAVQSQKIVNTGRMHYLQSSGLPLTALAGAMFVALYRAGHDIDLAVTAVNMMSAVCGALSVGFLYLFVRRFLDEAAARLAAVFAVINPFLVGLATFGNSHAPALLFLTAALYFAACYRQEGRRVQAVLAGIALGLMGAARIQDLVVMAPAVFFLTARAPDSTGRRDHRINLVLPWVIAAAVVVATYLPKFMSPDTSAAEEVGGFLYVHLLRHLDPLPLEGYANILESLLQTFTPFDWAAMAAGVIVLAVRRRTFELIFLALWFFVPVVVFGQLAFFVFRFLIVTVVALLVLEAAALAALWRRNRKWGAVVSLLLIAMMITGAARYYTIYYDRHQHARLVDFFRWIGETTEPQAYVVERDHSAWVEHYAQRRFIGADRSTAEGIARFRQTLDGLLAAGAPVYVTKHGLLDRSDRFRRTMVENYRLEYVGSRMMEDWHLGFMRRVVTSNDLLKIHPR